MFNSKFNRKPFAFFLIADAIICFVIALVSFIYSWHFVQIAARTDGKIIRMIEHKDKDEDTAYFPVFSFHDVQGVEHTIHSSSGSFPPEYEVGDIVPVLYNPNNPKSARIDAVFSIWGISLITGVICLVTLPAGLIILFWPNIVQRFKRKPSGVA